VVDTGVILPGKKVLLPPQAISRTNWEARLLAIPHTREEVKTGPSFDVDKPVSRRQEEELHEYYQWAPYWAPGIPFGAAPVATPPVPPPSSEEDKKVRSHLRSMREILGYAFVASDGKIGHIEDFVVQDADWVFRMVVIDTRDWLPGKKVAFSPQWIERLDWGGKMAQTQLTQERIRNAPEFDPNEPANETVEVRLYDYYGRPH
jgi:hypothetical protein